MFPIVEPESELVEVQGQILSLNLVENAVDRPLEQGPNIFNRVIVDIPGLHIAFLMVHGIMDKLRGVKPQVSGLFFLVPKLGLGTPLYCQAEPGSHFRSQVQLGNEINIELRY
jgi:hypothetical protein